MFLFGYLAGIATTLILVNLGKLFKRKAEDQILGKDEADKLRDK
jgi:hypothetical protein